MDYQRFTATAIKVESRWVHEYTYWVTGKGQFPYDMLRYDQCWPIERVGELNGDRTGLRSVKMKSLKPPTVERWTSFWWSVGIDPITK